MTADEFCYWLQGFFEIRDASGVANCDDNHRLSAAQVKVIREHLALVFENVTAQPASEVLVYKQSVAELSAASVQQMIDAAMEKVQRTARTRFDPHRKLC